MNSKIHCGTRGTARGIHRIIPEETITEFFEGTSERVSKLSLQVTPDSWNHF